MVLHAGLGESRPVGKIHHPDSPNERFRDTRGAGLCHENMPACCNRAVDSAPRRSCS